MEDNQRTLDAFNAAFNAHDVDAIMALMTPDCLFDNTTPPPDGTAYRGQDAVRQFWVEFFAQNPHAHFETESLVMLGYRAVQQWRYSWGSGHVRGVDVFAFRDGLVAEKLSYVKG